MPAADDWYSGSIIFTSPNSDDCHLYKWDNSTGRLERHGAGSCPSASNSQSTGQQKRVNAIADGFRNK